MDVRLFDETVPCAVGSACPLAKRFRSLSGYSMAQSSDVFVLRWGQRTLQHTINSLEKLSAWRRNSSPIKLSRLDKFRSSSPESTPANYHLVCPMLGWQSLQYAFASARHCPGAQFHDWVLEIAFAGECANANCNGRTGAYACSFSQFIT
jgi:hypothetical protein